MTTFARAWEPGPDLAAYACRNCSGSSRATIVANWVSSSSVREAPIPCKPDRGEPNQPWLRLRVPWGGHNIVGLRVEDVMRLACFSVTIFLALMSSAVQAQQSPGKPGDTIGHPPPLPGPPLLSEPSSTARPVPANPTPQATGPAPTGYTGAYATAGTPPTLYSAGPLPQSSEGPGLNIVGPDGVSTRTVKAVPCGVAAQETDGFTTCVGIPDQSPYRRRR